MPRDPRHDILFEPIHVGPKLLRNRFYQTAHSSMAGTDQPGAQARYRAVKAEGGWAVCSTEATSVSPEADTAMDAKLWDRGDARNLAAMCDEVHAHGALAAIELWHCGHNAYTRSTRLAPRGASALAMVPWAGPEFGGTCKPMDAADIREVQSRYVRAARMAAQIGFDIVTILMTHGDGVPYQFLLPFFNKRTDAYGGRFENRARFALELLEQVRQAVGETCAVTCRFGPDTLEGPEGLGDRGIRLHGDGGEFIRMADHLVDLWDVNLGTPEWGEDIAPSRTHRENHEAEILGGIRAYTAKPIINVGRFTSPDTMAQVLRSGQADIIGAARPGIADPFLPLKIEEGRTDEIRECIGCNVCIAQWAANSQPLICTQNPTVGEEYRRGWHPERYAPARNANRTVLVVGAGPAGMECAVVLGKRGMERVHLREAGAALGGSVRWIAELPGLAEWRRVIDYRHIQLEKLHNVDVITKSELTADEIVDYGADYTVIATGAHWAPDGRNGITHEPVPGADASLPHCVTPEQYMVDHKPVPGEHVVIFDCDGYFVAPALAERLALTHRVTYVTPLDTLAPYMRLTGEMPRLKREFGKLNIDVMTDYLITAVRRSGVRLADRWTSVERELEADAVILVTQRMSNLPLLDDVTNALGRDKVFAVGDCVAPGKIADAIFSGHRLAREIDTADPHVALPFIRERRLWGDTRQDDYAPLEYADPFEWAPAVRDTAGMALSVSGRREV